MAQREEIAAQLAEKWCQRRQGHLRRCGTSETGEPIYQTPPCPKHRKAAKASVHLLSELGYPNVTEEGR